MCKHFGEDKWLGQKKLPAMIIWKEKKSQKVTILHYLTGTLTPYLNLSHLTKGHQTRSCWNKKEKIFTKTRWRPSFWNWKMNESYIVIWNENREKSEKNPSLHHPKSLLSSANFLAPYWRESKICLCSKLFWTKCRTVIITTPP